jgi:hypothetical protein
VSKFWKGCGLFQSGGYLKEEGTAKIPVHHTASCWNEFHRLPWNGNIPNIVEKHDGYGDDRRGKIVPVEAGSKRRGEL